MNKCKEYKNYLANSGQDRNYNGAESLYIQLLFFLNSPWIPETAPKKLTKIDIMMEIIKDQPGITSEQLSGLVNLSYSSLQSYHPELRMAGCEIVRNGRKGMKFYVKRKCVDDF